MVAWCAHNPILLNPNYIVFLVWRNAEVAHPLRIHWVHVELLIQLCFFAYHWHTYFIGAPLGELVCGWHRKREIFIIVLDELVFYYVHKIIVCYALLIRVFAVKVVIAQHNTISLILEYDIKSIVQLVHAVLSVRWHLQGLEVRCCDVERIQFIHEVGAADHTQIHIICFLVRLTHFLSDLDEVLGDQECPAHFTFGLQLVLNRRHLRLLFFLCFLVTFLAFEFESVRLVLPVLRDHGATVIRRGGYPRLREIG